MTFINVVLCSSVLSSTNYLYDIRAMFGCTYCSGWEPQCFLQHPIHLWLDALQIVYSFSYLAAAWGS